MLNRHHHLRFLLVQLVGDALAISGALWGCYWLRFHSGWDPSAVESVSYESQFWWALGLWILALRLAHAYSNHPRIISFNRARRILIGSSLAVMLVVARNYFVRDMDVSRWLFLVAFFAGVVSIILVRVLLQWLIVRFFLSGAGSRSRVLILGTGTVAMRLANRCRMQPEYAYDLVGFVGINDDEAGRMVRGTPVIGVMRELRDIIKTYRIHEIFVTQANLPPDQLETVCLEAERENALVHVVPDLFEIMRTQIYYDEIAGVPIYSMKQTPLSGWNVFAKRGFDVLVATAGLIALAPLLLFLWWKTRRSIPNASAIYRQPRLSLDGQEFTCYKFRSMRPDAEAAGPGWGGAVDTRATPWGNFMRRTGLDELPQLWNVLRGDMSLVGPRPERPVYVDRFKEEIPRYMARHSVRTGITGWAQVHNLRGNTSVVQRLRYDLYYVENWSLWLDIKIVVMTVWKTLSELRRAITGAAVAPPPPDAEIAEAPLRHHAAAQYRVEPAMEAVAEKLK